MRGVKESSAGGVAGVVAFAGGMVGAGAAESGADLVASGAGENGSSNGGVAGVSDGVSAGGAFVASPRGANGSSPAGGVGVVVPRGANGSSAGAAGSVGRVDCGRGAKGSSGSVADGIGVGSSVRIGAGASVASAPGCPRVALGASVIGSIRGWGVGSVVSVERSVDSGIGSRRVSVRSGSVGHRGRSARWSEQAVVAVCRAALAPKECASRET